MVEDGHVLGVARRRVEVDGDQGEPDTDGDTEGGGGQGQEPLPVVEPLDAMGDLLRRHVVEHFARTRPRPGGRGLRRRAPKEPAEAGGGAVRSVVGGVGVVTAVGGIVGRVGVGCVRGVGEPVEGACGRGAGVGSGRRGSRWRLGSAVRRRCPIVSLGAAPPGAPESSSVTGSRSTCDTRLMVVRPRQLAAPVSSRSRAVPCGLDQHQSVPRLSSAREHAGTVGRDEAGDVGPRRGRRQRSVRRRRARWGGAAKARWCSRPDTAPSHVRERTGAGLRWRHRRGAPPGAGREDPGHSRSANAQAPVGRLSRAPRAARPAAPRTGPGRRPGRPRRGSPGAATPAGPGGRRGTPRAAATPRRRRPGPAAPRCRWPGAGGGTPPSSRDC